MEAKGKWASMTDPLFMLCDNLSCCMVRCTLRVKAANVVNNIRSKLMRIGAHGQNTTT